MSRPLPAPPHRPSSFRISGPSRPVDRRICARREDLAELASAGQIIVPHYAEPRLRRTLAPTAMLRAAPDDAAPALSQLMAGEAFALLDSIGDWAWGYSVHDHYVGYVRADALGSGADPTHRVTAPLALAFSAPDIKSPLRTRLPMGAQVHADTEDGAFMSTAHGWVHRRHVAPLTDRAPDPVAVAQRLVGTPYLWGGRAGDGLDCSGLVQLTLGFAGIAAPRDSDQQQAALGTPVADRASLRRGDLVFVPGHVAMMVDEARIIHANAHWMAVTIEPLADLLDRLDKPDVALRRIG